MAPTCTSGIYGSARSRTLTPGIFTANSPIGRTSHGTLTNYDTYWQQDAFAPPLNALKVPIMHVAGWWDQEDFYGPQHIYAGLEVHDTSHSNYFVAGPWNHGGWEGSGRRLGAIDFGSDTGAYYRDNIFQPW